MTRRSYKPRQPRLEQRWQVQREYFRADSLEPLVEGWFAVHMTEAEANTEMAKLNAGWANWKQAGDVLYVTPIMVDA